MEDTKTIIIKTDSTASEKFDPTKIVEFFYLCLSKWKWFVLSLALTLASAFLYLKMTPPKYTRSASVHIKEDSKNSSIGNITDEFARLGIGNTSSSVNNEEVAFNSLELAEQVVRQLHLDITYRTQHGLYKEELYGKSLPVHVAFPNLTDNDEVQIEVALLPSGEVKVDKKDYTGAVAVTRNEAYVAPKEAETIHVTKVKLSKATYDLHSHLMAVQNNTKNSIIDITYSDESIERAEAVINTLISEYNRNWVKDKNAMGVLTTQFIDERINAIQQELGGVDSRIASYKSSNLITDPTQAASLLMTQANTSDQQAITLSNQIQMCQLLYDHISKNARKMIPANVGIQSEEVNNQVAEYNRKLLQRNTYANNSSDSNPLVKNLDDELTTQRGVILQSLGNEKKSLMAQLESSQRTVNRSTSKLSSAPAQEKNLLTMDRQQKVKESLYLFLLQKREENELSQAFTAYNTRVICRPMGLDTPTSPVPVSIYMTALILAFLIPITILYIHELLYNKVRARKDIEKLSAPFIGEIPVAKSSPSLDVMVQQGNRDIVNEAFRIVRSNLNFMLHPNSDVKRKVILVTSANPGSGKTFVSLNLASTFGLQRNVKVAIIDLDIRKASLSHFVGHQNEGVTDYIGGFLDDWHCLMVPLGNVAVLPVGHIPPNPAELLQSDRLSRLLEEMKQEYDLVLLDMPPVEVVADVTIVKHLADLTIFVIRAGIMDRSMLPIIEKYYSDNTFNNLSILLNGTELLHHHYGYGRYGYGYGYGYGKKGLSL